MKYSLDTNIVSFYFKGIQGVVKNMQQLPPSSVFLSAPVVFEIEFGISKSVNRETKLRQFEVLLSVCGVVAFSRAEAKAAAEIRSQLERSGTPIGPYDLLIAATALAHGHVLVTNNAREFKRVRGLRVVDWTK